MFAHFYTSSHCFGDIKVWNVRSWKCRTRSRCTTFARISFDDEYQRNLAFSLALTVFQILAFQILWPWTSRSSSWCSAFDVKYITWYLVAIVILPLNLTIHYIRRWNKMLNIWPWKWISRSGRRKTRLEHSTGNVQFQIFFQNFSYLGTYTFTQTDITHKQIHNETGVVETGKICRADLNNKVFTPPPPQRCTDVRPTNVLY